MKRFLACTLILGFCQSCQKPCCEPPIEVAPGATAVKKAPVKAADPVAAPAVKAPSGGADWTTWGGDAKRNMVNLNEKNMPTEWDVKTGKNILWTAKLGSQSYGNPVIYKGKVFVGSNNEALWDPNVKGDKGNVLCFTEAKGKFIWQAIHDKLAAGRVNDWPLQGICSTAWIENDRAYYVNNRCELICADVNGFTDGKNDGYQDEQYKGDAKADIIWIFDMIEELGAFPHNLATSSPVLVGDLVILLTGNGVDEGHLNLPSPNSPSFVAINKNTGEWVWEYVDLERILHGQWSSPAAATIKGREQVIFPGGDGWIYSLNAKDGKLLWKFDGNPKDSKWELGGFGTKNNIISTPVIHDDKVFIGMGQDPEHGTGVGHLYAIDATGSGDVTDTHKVWHRGGDDFGRTMSTAAIDKGLMYITDLAGYLYCLDVKTGDLHWRHDLLAAVWSSPTVIDNKVYITDEDGDVLILEHSKTKKVINEIEMGQSIYTTPSAANGVLYITTKSKLYAIKTAE